MIPSLWLIADQDTGDVSYIHHGMAGDEANWRCIGPFAFTSKEAAEAMAQDPTFLPEGVEGQFCIKEVEPSSFIRAIFNGFSPVLSDVFVLDQASMPLSVQGATWIDDGIGSPIWTPLFDWDGEGAGLEWLDHVMKMVAFRLQTSMEAIQAIGNLNAAEEDESSEERNTQTIRQHMTLVIAVEPNTPSTMFLSATPSGNVTMDPGVKFWIHTWGLSKLGFPEQEFRNVPVWWVPEACRQLEKTAVLMMTDPQMKDAKFRLSMGPVSFTTMMKESSEPFWTSQGIKCFTWEVASVTFAQNPCDLIGIPQGPGQKPPTIH